jgi:DNA-binding HxlR family transcriptional regulator
MARQQESLMTAKTKIEHRSMCPVSRTLELVGDRWTLLVMRDALFFDCKTFVHFSTSKEGIPTNILSDRLRKLVEQGLLEKQPYQERPVRYEYVPTALGEELKPVMKAMRIFGEKHLGGKSPLRSS